MAEVQIDVAHMTRRLAETPQAFLSDVVVAALLSDVLDDLGHDPLGREWLDALGAQSRAPGSAGQLAWRSAAAVLAWLLADPLVGPHVPTAAVLDLLRTDLHALVEHVRVVDLVQDGDRREELSRLLLRAADITPAGERPEQAADRLATLDTVTRQRVIAEARAAEAHTREVREALARRRAQEAAAKAMRE